MAAVVVMVSKFVIALATPIIIYQLVAIQTDPFPSKALFLNTNNKPTRTYT